MADYDIGDSVNVSVNVIELDYRLPGASSRRTTEADVDIVDDCSKPRNVRKRNNKTGIFFFQKVTGKKCKVVI